MVSVLDSGASRPGSGPGRGHYVVFSTQVYKWVPANLMLGVALHPIPRGVEILLVASWYKNRDKLRLNGPLGS